ncbi:MAG: hypothetical protein IIC18_05795, partial [Bacteroidetes bacterium]|nr:hypothetical protein [Bacteroidota bacterium]
MSSRLLLAALLMSAPSLLRAEDFDYEAHGFWNKQYSIPNVYETYIVEVEVADVSKTRRRVRKLLNAAGAKTADRQRARYVRQREIIRKTRSTGGTYSSSQHKPVGPGDHSSVWDVPTKKADKTAQAILRMGTILEYKKQNKGMRAGSGTGSMDELLFKSQVLEKEFGTIKKA